jgi:hypothetical protein
MLRRLTKHRSKDKKKEGRVESVEDHGRGRDMITIALFNIVH